MRPGDRPGRAALSAPFAAHCLKPLLATLLVVLGSATATQAEIYRWVDEQGNVHFGDRPQDAATAAEAEAVELRESYRPPVMSDEERAAQRAAEKARWDALIGQREDEEAADAREKAERASRQKELDEACARMRAELERLSGITYDQYGRRVRTYIAEDGKSVSAERQKAMIEEWRAEMQAAGCENPR